MSGRPEPFAAAVLKPDIRSTLVVGLTDSIRLARSMPLMIGITTSVSRRCTGCVSAIRRASNGSPVSITW